MAGAAHPSDGLKHRHACVLLLRALFAVRDFGNQVVAGELDLFALAQCTAIWFSGAISWHGISVLKPKPECCKRRRSLNWDFVRAFA